MAIDLNALYLAAASALGEAVMTIISFGLVYMVANTAYRCLRRVLADSRSGAPTGGDYVGEPMYFEADDHLPGIPEDEYERQRLYRESLMDD